MSGCRKSKLKFLARPRQESAPLPDAPESSQELPACNSMVLNVVAVRSMSRFTLCISSGIYRLHLQDAVYSLRNGSGMAAVNPKNSPNPSHDLVLQQLPMAGTEY